MSIQEKLKISKVPLAHGSKASFGEKGIII
jgi:hypothetical protein